MTSTSPAISSATSYQNTTLPLSQIVTYPDSGTVGLNNGKYLAVTRFLGVLQPVGYDHRYRLTAQLPCI
ncbi:MAG TPA: hypothetical protein P5121_04405 [Caldilineaceae bacterium]|nr:hypothetical protein [Caldilineaceae bacterium]